MGVDVGAGDQHRHLQLSSWSARLSPANAALLSALATTKSKTESVRWNHFALLARLKNSSMLACASTSRGLQCCPLVRKVRRGADVQGRERLSDAFYRDPDGCLEPCSFRDNGPRIGNFASTSQLVLSSGRNFRSRPRADLKKQGKIVYPW
jgi:hypothetical protein